MTTFPTGADDVTAEWLSEALGTEITAVEVLDEHSGTTGRLRLGLTSADGPDSVFVKLPPPDEGQQKLVAATDMGRREARWYEGPAAEAPLRVPGCHFAAHGEERTEYVMVLEDLAAAGASFSNRLETGAEAHGGQLVESLARLHAHFWEDPRFDGELDWVRPPMRGRRGAEFVALAKEKLADDFPPVFAELCDLYVEQHEAITELWDDGEPTLIHGDTHAGNQFVEDGVVGLYDWAVISRAPGIRDVAIYLGNSVPTEVRRAHQEEWLAGYRRVLVEAGVDAPPADVLWDRYRRCVLYAWIAAATTLAMGSRWQPVEVGMLGTTRATQTCADLDTIGAFRDAI
jgi:hypothetical protein